MLLVVIGVAFGVVIGLLGNTILFRKLEENRRIGAEPLRGVGGIFFLRYALDAASLFAFAFIVKDKWAIISAALSLTVAVKISLLLVYTRKGGRFD